MEEKAAVKESDLKEKNNMETALMNERKEKLKKSKKRWKAKVVTFAGDVVVTSEFTSENNTIEDIMHKIGLDLMTNLEHNITTPIGIQIWEEK